MSKVIQSHSNLYEQIMIPRVHAPIIILYGPPMCGKTMTLLRLCHYLRTRGYLINPCIGFRSNPYYVENCHSFIKSINTLAAQPGNGVYDDMFVEISDSKGHFVCYIYDAAGDFYVNPMMPPWIFTLFASGNPKIWCFYTEPHYADLLIRQKYVQTIDRIYHHFVEPSKDRNIIIHNKIDQTPFMLSPQVVNVAATLQSVENLYPGLFDIFKNTSFIQKWFKPYKFSFVPFMTGKYINDNDYCAYIPGPDIYPANLWKAIL